MLVGVYVRVSTQTKQHIDMQTHFLKDYAKRNNLHIYQIYADIGESGKKDSRPSFDLMLEDLRSGKFKAILVYKLDRIGRSLIHLVKLFEEFAKKNIEFISATQNINTTTPEGKLFLRMLMILSEYEREMTVSNIKRGLQRARARGKQIGQRGKDKKQRRKSGYFLRWAGSKKTPPSF